MPEISEEMAKLIDHLEGKDFNSRLEGLLEKEYGRRLTKYQYMDRFFQKKHGMTFEEFERRNVVKQLNYSFEVESDSNEWELALDGVASMERLLAELTRIKHGH